MNIHNRLMRAVGRVNASAAAVRKAKFRKEGWLEVHGYQAVSKLQEMVYGGKDGEITPDRLVNMYVAAYNSHYGPILDEARKMVIQAGSNGYNDEYKDANGNTGHSAAYGARGGDRSKELVFTHGIGGNRNDKLTYFEGTVEIIEVGGCTLEVIPMFPLSDAGSSIGEEFMYEAVVEDDEGEEHDVHIPCYLPEYYKINMEWGDTFSLDLGEGVSILDAHARDQVKGTFALLIKNADGSADIMPVTVGQITDSAAAARIIVEVILALKRRHNELCRVVESLSNIKREPLVASAPITIEGEDVTGLALNIAASYDNTVENGFVPNWKKDLEEQYPSLITTNKKVTVGDIVPGEAGNIFSDTDLTNTVRTVIALPDGISASMSKSGTITKSDYVQFRIAKALMLKSEDVEEVEDVEDAEDEIEITEDEIMETPEEVKKAMRLVKAWNKFMKEAENGVTSGAQFDMGGANDSEGENPAYTQQDANDIVDEEYETETNGSAIDATGLAGEDMIADEDMTVDSADAVAAVPAVAKSMRRLCKALVRKAEEANPEMTEEQKEEVEDAAAEDLKDPEATAEIAECMKAEGDEELADKLEDHAELLEKARKSLFAKNEGDVGAVALPSEEVGVATESVVDKAGDANDNDMPPSAVDEAGTDKIDVTADLDDHEVAKVEEEPEKENPGYILPEDDVPMQAKTVSDKSEAEDKELAKAYRMLGAKKGMSITDMIAMKRGQRIETADAAEESAEEGSIEVFKPTSAGPRGYRPVELGRGKTMMPPFKH